MADVSPPDPEIIDDPAALSPEWLSDVLRRAGHDVRVDACRHESVGTGQMAHNERIFLEYAGDAGSAPRTLVGKFPSPSPESRAAGGSGGYKAEVYFYRELADRLSIRVPKCYFAALSDDGTRFVLLLEDMAPAEQGDQIAGASSHEIEAAVVNLAGLHAPLWNAAELDGLDWATMSLSADFAPVLEMAAPAFVERYEDRLSAEAREVLLAFGRGYKRWAQTQPSDRTLVHGDYRLDNQLFGTRDGGARICTVDWQTISAGSGARDLAYMLGNACPPEQRRSIEPAMLEAYRRAMADLGVELTPDQIRADYRHGSFQGPLVTMLGALAVGQTDRGDDMFMVMAERSAAQIRDLEALPLILG